MNKRQFKCYADALDFFNGKRRPVGGRRKVRSSWYMTQDASDKALVVSIEHWGGRLYPIFRITPDNTLTFTVTRDQLQIVNNTLSMILHKVVPLSAQRVGMLRYDIKRCGDPHYWTGARLAELFDGLQIDLISLNAKNGQPSLTDPANIDEGARREWLRCKRRFIRQLQVRKRVGLFDEIFISREKQWLRRRDGVEVLYRALTEETLTNDTIEDLCNMYGRHWYGNPADGANACYQSILTYLNSSSHNLPVRMKFGVFKSEVRKDADV